MKISIIAAVAANGIIGDRGRLPWHLPADLKRFKELTIGHTVVMGRKTFESLGRPLPKRRNIVVTKKMDYLASGCMVVTSINEALAVAQGEDEVFFIGGAEIYAQVLDVADQVYLTFINHDFPGDKFFPKLDLDGWNDIEAVQGVTDRHNPYEFWFFIFKRKI